MTGGALQFASSARSHRIGRQRGLSLIEVMIAVALMAIASLMAWQGLENISSAHRRLTQDTQSNEALLRALGQLERDISQRLVELTPAPDRALPDSLSLHQMDQRNELTQLDILRRDGSHPGHWQHVSWAVDGQRLIRRSGPSAQQYPLPPPQQAVVLLEHVQRVTLRGWQAPNGWQLPPFAESNTPLLALEVTIELISGAGTESFRRVIKL